MNIPHTATEILDNLLAALHLHKDVQLAAALGVSPQAVSQARKKNKIPENWLMKAAVQYGLSLDSLVFKVFKQAGADACSPSPTQGHETESSAAGFRPPAQVVPAGENQSSVDLLLVPLVAARLSAGTGSLETESEILGHFAFREDWLIRKGNPDNMVLMRVYGDSMEPTIQHGDMALIDQGKTRIVPHTIYAVGVNEEIYIKQVETLPGHRMILRSHNERYAPIEVDLRGDMADSVRIIGKVIWWCREA